MRPPSISFRCISISVIKDWTWGVLYDLSAPVYGQANAPRRWFLYVLGVMLKLRWCQHTLDPRLFLLIINIEVVALLGIHVDDIVATARKGYEQGLWDVKAFFTWGTEWEVNDFIFVGRHIKKHDNHEITLDQSH